MFEGVETVMTKVAILGAAGRMGRTLIRCAQRMEGIQVVAAIELKDSPSIGQDAGTIAELPEIQVKITDDLKAMSSADVAIDFTLHDAVAQHAGLATELGVPMVIGATGLDAAERAAIEKAAVTVPIVWAPNMSLGVNLLFSVLKKAGQVLGRDYKVEIDETHHVNKKDSPSGTALRLGGKVAEGLGVDFKTVMVHEHREAFASSDTDEEKIYPSYPDGSILIRSYREGEVIGDHTVTFGNDGETIEFTHHAWSREAFAMGALRAAQWVVTQRPGRIYDMQDVLGL
jgi:4-hydroxy-tetrahydrodipicolinate reductase